MTEPTVQVPVSLIERALLILRGPYAAQTADEFRALLSQPTPTAEPLPYESGDDRYRRVTGKEPPAHIDSATDLGNYWHDAEPPRIEDMVPGTTFTAQYQAGAFHGGAARWRKIHASIVALVSTGTAVPAGSIDPSTIRDVTPPKDAA